jgi:hypothetical protein
MRRSALTSKLQLALDVCRAVGPTLTGEICFRWISPEFKAKGVNYHDLAQLARLGHLVRTSEGRYAVFYRLTTSKQRRERPRSKGTRGQIRYNLLVM